MAPSKDEPPAPKIAIKGFSLSSSAKPKSKLPPPTTLGKRPRSTFASHDSDSEDERGNARVETVSGFEDGGAVGDEWRDGGRGKGNGGQLVIPRMGNRDWKGEARSRRGGGIGDGGDMRKRGNGKNLLPADVQAERAANENGGKGKEEGVDIVNSKDGEMEWGLSFRKQEKDEEVRGEGEGEGEGGAKKDKEREEEKEIVVEEQKPKTADEEALAALLGTNKEKKGPDLVISSGSNQNQQATISETDAYRAAIASAPEASTLEDYERVPVEEFGAALLRGMGWKGESHGKVKDVKRRQNLLGLGARELKEAEELGAWVQKSDVKRLKPGSGGGGDRRGGGKVRVSEFKREEDRRRELREERGGGSYRREVERERRDERDRRDRRDRRR